MKLALVLSCEHGGHRVPAKYRRCLPSESVLASHRGWDRGALVLARELARRFEAPLVAATTTRLLIETNRSIAHPRLFSKWSRALPEAQRRQILERYWRPHRDAVEGFVRSALDRHGRVLHLSVHSFTPRLKGRLRAVDVGLLYDPARRAERAFADAWLLALRDRTGALRLRRNQPYRGNSDGLTTSLRALFGPRYLGLELEVNQRLVIGPPARWRRLRRDLADSLAEALPRPRVSRVALTGAPAGTPA